MEKPTDMELVMGLINHIDNPCSFEYQGKKLDARNIYLREANWLLGNHEFSNPFAKELLERKIEEYS